MDNACYVVGENQQKIQTLLITAQEEKKDFSYTFILERNAFLRVEIVCAHVDVQMNITCILVGEGSQAVINGAYVLHKENKVSISTVQHHKAAHTHSSLIMRSIVDDNATISYDGMIRVEKEAGFSVSLQENKNMLLSDRARALSVPQLEVLTHDVQCFHGSAMSRPDQDSLFYGASRGIDEQQMSCLLNKAFFADMFTSVAVTHLLGELCDGKI